MKSRKSSLVLVLLASLFIISLLNIINVKANEKNVVKLVLSENGEVSPPVFDFNDGYIYPGAKINKDFILKNTTPRKYKIDNIILKNFMIKDINGRILDINNYIDSELIEEFYGAIECKVSCDGIFNDKILYADDIKELIKGKTLQSDISILSGNEKEINVSVFMKTSTGNNMQGLQANFNLVFNATSINESTVVDPPVQPPVDPTQPPLDPPGLPPIQPPLQPPTDPITEPAKPTELPIGNPDISGNTGGTDNENPGTKIDLPEGSSSGNIDKDLVQTGSPIDTLTLSITGLIFIGTGSIILFKKK